MPATQLAFAFHQTMRPHMPRRTATPPVRRAIPRDFETRYLELGLKGCCEHYGAWNRTVRRWLEILGRDRLRARRLELVQARRKAAAATKIDFTQLRRTEARRRAVCSNEPMPPADVIRDAAHYLRTPSGGRNLVCPSGYGDWFVGSVRVTPQDLVRRAKAKGFVG